MTDRNDDQAQQPTTPPVVRLAAAEVDAVAARDRLKDTVARLQSKLDPKLLAEQAVGEAKAAGTKGADYARQNPAIVGGAAGLVLLYLVRKPLGRLFRRRKGPKPQKAAKPMTATAPNERLARSPHPAETAPPAPQAPASPQAPAAQNDIAPLPPAATSNEGAPLEGTNA